MGPMLYLPYVRTTRYLRRKTAQTQRAITSRATKIAQSLDKIKYNTLTPHVRHHQPRIIPLKLYKKIVEWKRSN